MEVWERSGDPSGWPRCLEALPTGVGGVGSSTLGPGGVARPLRWAGIGEDALPEIRDGLGETGEVESPFLRDGRGRKVLQKGWEGSGVPHSVSGVPLKVLGGVGRPSRRAGQCRAEVDGNPVDTRKYDRCSRGRTES